MPKILQLWARISGAGRLLQEEASLGYIMKSYIKKKKNKKPKTGRNQVIDSFLSIENPICMSNGKGQLGSCGILERFRSRNLSLTGPQLSSQWERSAVASQVSVCMHPLSSRYSQGRTCFNDTKLVFCGDVLNFALQNNK